MNIEANSPFVIANRTFPHRLIQAPLAGISCAAFRELFSKYLSPAYAVTEMISAQSMLNHHRLKPRYLTRSQNEGTLCIQLSGHNADDLYRAAQIAESYNPDLIDLNCGCPKPKIRSKGSGSALIDNVTLLAKIVANIRKATSLPFTVKIRVAGQTSDLAYLDAIKAIEDNGADAIIVHGRHHTESYETPVNYQQIKQVVEQVTIPIIANGDVKDHRSLRSCLAETGASAVMIGRAAIGKPWLYQQLIQPDFVPPTYHEIVELFLSHIHQLATIEQNDHIALLQGRRLLKWYFPELNQEQLSQCYQMVNIKELYGKLATFLRLHPEKA